MLATILSRKNRIHSCRLAVERASKATDIDIKHSQQNGSPTPVTGTPSCATVHERAAINMGSRSEGSKNRNKEDRQGPLQEQHEGIENGDASVVDTTTTGDADWKFGYERTWWWRLKLKLQWSGWLQFMLPFNLAFGLLAPLGLVEYLAFDKSYVGWPLATLLIVVGTAEIFLMKAGWAPPEPLPRKMSPNASVVDAILARKSCRSHQRRRCLTPSDKQELLETARIEIQKDYERAVRDAKQEGRDSDTFHKIRLEWIAKPLRVWPGVNMKEFFVAIAGEPYNMSEVQRVGRTLQKVVVKATQMGIGTWYVRFSEFRRYPDPNGIIRARSRLTCHYLLLYLSSAHNSWIGPGADQEAIIAELQKLDDFCFDPSQHHVICVCAIGYKSVFSPLLIRLMGIFAGSFRKPFEELFFFRDETAGNNKVTPVILKSRGGSKHDFYQSELAATTMKPALDVCRWSPSSFNSQTTRAVIVGSPGNSGGEESWNRIDFYRSKKSRYYAVVAEGIWMANFEMACEELGIAGEFRTVRRRKPQKQNSARNGKAVDLEDVDDDNDVIIKPWLYDVSWVFNPPLKKRTMVQDLSISSSMSSSKKQR